VTKPFTPEQLLSEVRGLLVVPATRAS